MTTTRTRAGWAVEVAVPKGWKGQVYRHTSGWRVQHCGHPTANYPYYAVPPDKDGIVVATHGHGWAFLIEAMEDVEGLAAGRLVLDGGELNKPGVRRAVTPRWYEERTRMLQAEGGQP